MSTGIPPCWAAIAARLRGEMVVTPVCPDSEIMSHACPQKFTIWSKIESPALPVGNLGAAPPAAPTPSKLSEPNRVTITHSPHRRVCALCNNAYNIKYTSVCPYCHGTGNAEYKISVAQENANKKRRKQSAELSFRAHYACPDGLDA